MNKNLVLVVALVAVVALAGGGIFLATRNNQNSESSNTNNSENSTQREEDSMAQVEEVEEEEMVEETGPVPFSEIGEGILDAKENFSYFTFENGEGTCMAQGFPTDFIYDSENIAKTLDGSYADEWTAVDFLGNIRFSGLPLSTGSADCMIETSSASDMADVSCSVDEVEVCTASFEIFGVR